VIDLLERVRNTCGGINGIIHSAGNSPTSTSTGESDDFRGKVDGAMFLHTHSQMDDIKWFVVYSSVSALFGNHLHNTYSAANAVLDGLVSFRRSQSLPGLSIQWPAIRNVGMAAAGSDQFKQEGLWCTAKQFRETLEFCLQYRAGDTSNQVDVVNSLVPPSMMDAFNIPTVLLPFLSSVVNRDRSMELRPVEEKTHVYVAESLEEVTAVVQDLVMSLLGTKNDIDPQTSLMESGLDSIGATELAHLLNKRFGLSLNVSTVIFECPTLEALSQQIFQATSNQTQDDGGATSETMSSTSSGTSLKEMRASESSKYQKVEIQPCTQTETISLTADDVVPRDIVAFFVQDKEVESDRIIGALQAVVDANPMLAGSVSSEDRKCNFVGTTSDSGVTLEITEQNISTMSLLHHFDSLPNPFILKRFGPSPSNSCFAVKVSHLIDGTVMVLRASHKLVDGSGLSMILHNLQLSLESKPMLPLTHDRSLLPRSPSWNGIVPPGYRIPNPELVAKAASQLSLMYSKYPLVTFVVSDEVISEQSDVSNPETAWHHVTALLWQWSIHSFPQAPHTELAMWYDLRGIFPEEQLPRNFAGNAGMYWHIKHASEPQSGVANCHLEEVVQTLESTSPQNDPSIRSEMQEAYLQWTAATESGNDLYWTGHDDHVLPMNLVVRNSTASPRIRGHLSRNVHGFRVTRIGNGFFVESSLSQDRQGALVQYLQQELLVEQVVWHGNGCDGTGR